MAAVSVVLPWSMCPIVPMLTWGFVLVNFSFAIAHLLLAFSVLWTLSDRLCLIPGGPASLDPGDDVLLDLGRRLVVLEELQAEDAPPLGQRPEDRRIAEHLRERDQGPDGPGAGPHLHGLDLAPAGVEVADDV